MGFEALQVLVMEGFHRRVLDGAIHAFGLAVGPRMVGFGQAVSILFSAQTRSKIWPKHMAVGPA